MSARTSAAAAWCLRPANRRVGLALSRKKKKNHNSPFGFHTFCIKLIRPLKVCIPRRPALSQIQCRPKRFPHNLWNFAPDPPPDPPPN